MEEVAVMEWSRGASGCIVYATMIVNIINMVVDVKVFITAIHICVLVRYEGSIVI